MKKFVLLNKKFIEEEKATISIKQRACLFGDGIFETCRVENGKIYKITNTVDDRIYVGSTTKELKVRFREHACFSKIEKYKNIELYKAMNEHGVDKFKIELVENYPCENKIRFA